jgi:succinate-semialdehyde dehydrogenase / glutarate-semialdehyde dehydrogenase
MENIIKSINPFNNSLLKEFQEFDLDKINLMLSDSESSFEVWKNTDFDYRSKLMLQCAEQLRQDKQNLAELMTMEMGKPVKESLAEIEKCAACCEFYAHNARKFLSDEMVESDASKSFITYSPLGCILAVMPWNFPFWQVFRFAAPALMAGNVALLKHASNVPQCALAIENIFLKAGFPNGVFQTALIGSSQVKYIIDHKVVKAVTLTGSEKAGAEVASIAGKNIKKTVLELGGSDAFVVLKDADIDLAADIATKSRMINTGQSCIAAKRFIVAKEVLEEFTAKMVGNIKKLKIGDPMDLKTNLGTIAREDLVQPLLDQIQESIKRGAKVVIGGDRPNRIGAFLNPTVLMNVASGMPAYDEEIFGPVAAIITANDESDAVRIANDSRYGLGGSVWTRDQEKGERIARMIESGAVFVNGMVKSDSRLPFGGIKNSGYGRELSYLGIREFVNIKTIWIR